MANLGIQNNNPGNLRDPATGNFQVFNSPEEGHQALINDLKIKQSGQSSHIKPGASLEDFANVWAPASDKNNPKNYANTLAKVLGVNTAEAFDSVPIDKLAGAIKVAEGTSSMPDFSTPTKKYSTSDFAQKIRTKYNAYQNVDDNTLVTKFLAKYPVYSDRVENPTPSIGDQITKEQAPTQEDNKQTPGGFIGKIADFIGGSKLAQGLGQTISNMEGNQDEVIKANENAMKIQSDLIEHIKENKSQGKDTTRLENALTELTKNIQETSGKIEDIGTGGLTNKQVLGSATQLATNVVGGKILGAIGSVGGRIAASSGIGALSSASEGLSQGEENVGKKAIEGALVGGALGSLGEVVGYLGKKIPGWFTKAALPKLKDGNIDYATNVLDYGSARKNLAISDKATKSLSDSIQSVLHHPEYENEVGNLNKVLNTVIDNPAFKNADITPKQIGALVNEFAPLQKKLIPKILNGTATLAEQNELRVALDSKIYPSIADKINPKITDSKKILKALTDALRLNVQETAPSTQGLFSMWSKEINLNNALKYATTKGSKGLDMGDLISMVEAGPWGMVGKRLATSKTVLLNTAKATKVLAPKITSTIGGVTGGLSSTVSNIINP